MNIRKKLLYSAFTIGVLGLAGMGGFAFANKQSALSIRRSEDGVVAEGIVSDAAIHDDNSEEVLGASRDRFDGSITYKGDRYEVNTSIDKVLFLGIDTSLQERDGTGIQEGGRSDVIILFAIDNEKRMITPLVINRDTMVQVDIYDKEGNFLTSGEEQLTMQYSYGNSVRKSCSLTKEKVSDILGRIRIDGVVSLTMEGIEPIVDSIGGVLMKMESDLTDIDPEFKEGVVVRLNGTKAKAFIHDRDVEVRGSNIDRMSRQTQFMMALFTNIQEKGGQVIKTMEDAAGDYLYEEMDADSIDHFTDYEFTSDVVILPGENVEGKLHDEYYLDEEGVMETVLGLFYKKVTK